MLKYVFYIFILFFLVPYGQEPPTVMLQTIILSLQEKKKKKEVYGETQNQK